MNRGLYTAASAMSSSQVWLDTVANNLANASATGYKRDEVEFEESLLRELRSNGGNGKIVGDLQSGPLVSKITTSFERGSTMATGNGLDVAINTPTGMFAIETPTGTKYTRAGSFTLNSNRELVNQDGHRVLDQNLRPIRVSADGSVKISADGTVEANGTAAGQVGVFTGTFTKVGQNQFSARGRVSLQANSVLTPGALESSNVNVVSTMIEMVQVQRLFEMAQKSVQNHDETTSELIKTLNPN
ncbi:MAG: flagellar hook-basal body protein [Chthonomonas sp.]|nr:flagellar hook-basal body protein [Chthonomonas sp.]